MEGLLLTAGTSISDTFMGFLFLQYSSIRKGSKRNYVFLGPGPKLWVGVLNFLAKKTMSCLYGIFDHSVYIILS